MAKVNIPSSTGDGRVIKVLVWDLDDTLWSGTLLSGDAVEVRPAAEQTLDTLDRRGILHSIASRNDPETALGKLRELELEDYFIYPQIGWSAKSVGIRKIAESINVGLDAVAFIDDQPFELEEVAHAVPQVLTLHAAELAGLTERPEFVPRFITDESAIRRRMYQADITRQKAQEEFTGPDEGFLASLEMRFLIAPATEEDLRRAEELTVRTNQLNSTGVTYSYEELDGFRRSDRHLLLVASLEDKWGTYGKIGLALVELGSEVWTLKLLLMSCRVMARGVGAILLGYVMRRARQASKRLQAELRSTERNRMMVVTYRFAGFEEVERRGEVTALENDLTRIQAFPDYVDVRIDGESG
ncbi:MAG: HAD-IIIC family phosphatase [Thermoanaerobaculia bacterium]